MGITSFIVTVFLTVSNTSNGTELEKIERHWMVRTSPMSTQIEALQWGIERCRLFGVDQAKHVLTPKWKKELGHDWVTTNVDCDWERGEGT